jgi:hypothetical protein
MTGTLAMVTIGNPPLRWSCRLDTKYSGEVLWGTGFACYGHHKLQLRAYKRIQRLIHSVHFRCSWAAGSLEVTYSCIIHPRTNSYFTRSQYIHIVGTSFFRLTSFYALFPSSLPTSSTIHPSDDPPPEGHVSPKLDREAVPQCKDDHNLERFGSKCRPIGSADLRIEIVIQCKKGDQTCDSVSEEEMDILLKEWTVS